MATQKELAAQWIALGYRKGMASATITPPPAKAFRRVYHVMQGKWALVAIDDQRLKISRFEDLNDPFELLAMNRHTQAARKASKQFRAAVNASQGLLCFGADWSSSVMWSHYADKHKGICLGFDVRRSLLQEVKYKDSRLRLALGDTADPAALSPELQHQLTCTKAKTWSGPRRNTGDSSIYGPPCPNRRTTSSPSTTTCASQRSFSETRCPENLDAVRKRLERKHPSVIAFKARLAYRSFRVVLNGYTRPSGSPTK